MIAFFAECQMDDNTRRRA